MITEEVLREFFIQGKECSSSTILELVDEVRRLNALTITHLTTIEELRDRCKEWQDKHQLAVNELSKAIDDRDLYQKFTLKHEAERDEARGAIAEIASWLEIDKQDNTCGLLEVSLDELSPEVGEMLLQLKLARMDEELSAQIEDIARKA